MWLWRFLTLASSAISASLREPLNRAESQSSQSRTWGVDYFAGKKQVSRASVAPPLGLHFLEAWFEMRGICDLR
jgi:hypothetical protein